MVRVFTAASAELFELQAIRSCLLVLRRYVIAALTIAALQYNVVAWHNAISDFRLPISTSIQLFDSCTFFQSAIGNWKSAFNYSTTSDTVPVPTVRPPS